MSDAVNDAKPYTLPECGSDQVRLRATVEALERAVAARAALASTPAPASMPLAEVEALKMRVAEMVRIRCFSLVDYGEGGRDEVLRNIKALDLAAVVKGVK